MTIKLLPTLVFIAFIGTTAFLLYFLQRKNSHSDPNSGDDFEIFEE